MDVPETKKQTSIERKGGYPAGERPVSQLTPPPKGPGAGSKPSDNGKQPEKPR
jgi:hypothetical protein